MLLFKQSKKVLLTRFLISLAIAAFAVAGFSQFPGEGAGTEQDPFQVANAEHLAALSNFTGADHANVFFVQTANIQLQGIWTPIGPSAANSFHGNYDGDGFTIEGLATARDSRVGMFSYTTGATLENMNLEDANVLASHESGILAAVADDTTFENISITGVIDHSTNFYFGGIAGRTTGNTSFHRCRTDVESLGSGRIYLGNLVGQHSGGTITECYTLGSITSTSTNADFYSGGFVGRLNGGEIINSYSMTSIVMPNNNNHLGGFVGDNVGRSITNCYTVGMLLSNGRNVDGFAGQNTGQINNSYWSPEMVGQAESDGGEPLTTLQMLAQDSYEEWDFDEVWNIDEGSFPFLAWEGDEASGHHFPPLLPPSNLATEACEDLDYIRITWDEPSLEEPEGYHVYRAGERINEELVEQRSFQDDDVDLWTPYFYTVTAVYMVDDLPAESAHSAPIRGLITQFNGGEGTAESPWLVANTDQLNGVRYALDAHYRQTADIDLADIEMDKLGEADNDAQAFTGVYDGDGFEIRNFAINDNYAGLFGFTRSGAEILNLHLVDVNIDSGSRAGGIAGQARNTRIEGCSVIGGRVNGRDSMGYGGIAGYTYNNTSIHRTMSDVELTSTGTGGHRYGGLVGYHGGGVISESFALNDVRSERATTADIMLGGLVGWMASGEIRNCYAMGTVISTANCNMVGGLVGQNTRPLINSYSVAAVRSTGNDVGGLIGSNTGEITNSFWAPDLSGMAESAGGQPRNVRQLMDQDTYTDWDFDEVWNIDENSMAYLAWEGDEAPEHVIPEATLPPSNLQAEISAERDEITITWDEPALLEPIGYNIYRNDEQINDEMIEEEEFDDTNVQDWTWYTYQVTAVYMIDGEREESNRSGAIRVIIDAFAGGSGTADDPYLVADEAQLRGVANILDAHYRQTADIDLQMQAWEPIGDSNNRFEGVYDGDDFEIINMHFDVDDSYVGLFGYTDWATLENIQLVDVDIRGSSYTGALVGRADNTTINNCSSGGRVRGTGTGTGGLLGRHTGTVNDSHSSADVESTGAQTGGFAGDSSGNANRNFATGDIEGQDRVGGYAGSASDGSHNQVFAAGNVEGTNEVGGLFGFIQTASYNNMYATGDVTGNSQVGGLIGNHNLTTNNVTNGYSIGRVTGDDQVGGLIGRLREGGGVTNCYWNVRTSGQEESAAGEGRDELQMTYPYGEDTYVEWDFENIWVTDVQGLNAGYPYFPWQPLFTQPYPYIAESPDPRHRATGVSVAIDSLRWVYTPTEGYTNPIGFRVYFSETEEFADEFEWVEYTAGENHYGTGEVLAEELDYLATYYWKVVPTVNDPDDDGRSDNRSLRNNYAGQRSSIQSSREGDARNVPVWEFTAEVYPDPVPAKEPVPKDEAEDVHVSLEQVAWSFVPHEEHANPAGFRVYMNKTGEFGDDDEYVWVNFVGSQVEHSTSDVLPEQLEYNQTYYWKVVPTTQEPDGRSSARATRSARAAGRLAMNSRHDAEGVEVWSFTTVATEPYPLPAKNPEPEHLAEGISLGLEQVSWEYYSSEIFADPAGFRIYMNATGTFGPNAPYIWVDYEEGETEYNCSEVIPFVLDENTTYYWRVIPTTEHPDDAGADARESRNTRIERQISSLRNDAEGVQIWRFTTGETSADDETTVPVVTELHGNYPNPFNPQTNISFALAEQGRVTVEIFNSRGQKIRTLVDDYLPAGNHSIVWDGRDSSSEVSSGIYFYRMKKGDYSSTYKMIMIK